MNTMRVLLAADSIITLDVLLNEMSTRSWPTGTEVRVLSVVEDVDVPEDVWREMGYGTDALRHEMGRRGELITTLATMRLSEVGIPSKVIIMRGNPASLITLEAWKWSANLILIRANNRTGFRNWLLGSVAKSVLASAACTVNVVRPDENQVLTAKRPTRILLATDGSESSIEAARAIAQAIWAAETEVRVVSVVKPPLWALGKIGLSLGGRRDNAHRAIGKVVQMLKETPVGISAAVISGRPAQTIIDEATSWRATLIVIGKREQRGLFSRSISETVASLAHCSVKVVRRDSSEDGQSLARDREPSVQRRSNVYELSGNRQWKRVA
ncbi:MAG: universal stress protein [Acidobacteriota bacterium]